MLYFKEWRKKREIIHDFGKMVKIQEVHLAEIFRRQSVIPVDIFNVIKFVLEENIDYYKSIIILYNNGQFQSCLLIGRSIIENSINLRYILQEDTERRAKNFVLHSTTSFLKGLKSIKENMPGKDEMIRHLEELQNQQQKSGSHNFKWDGKSFKQICIELNLETIYDAWYSRLSKYVHSQYKAVRNLDEERPYNNFLKKLVSKDMLVLTLQTLKDINSKYNLQEGGVIIYDYPENGSALIFSISSKEIDEKMKKY